MVSRVFTLASIATLTGAVMAAGAAGCTNDDDGAATTDVDAGATGTDAGRDRFVPSESEDDEDEPAESCASKEPIDTTNIPYAKASTSPGACGSDEMAALVKYYGEHDMNTISVADWAATVSATCAACAFTPSDAEAWGPLLVEGDTLVGVNRGGCVELASKKEACGRAYEQTISCLVLSCPTPARGGTCSTSSEFDECRNEVFSTGPCAAAYAEVNQECGSDLQAYERACRPAGAKYDIEGPLAAHCGGTAPDGDGADDGG